MPEERAQPEPRARPFPRSLCHGCAALRYVKGEATWFLRCTALPQKFETATANPRLNAVVVEADEQTGRATDIERLSYSAEELQQL